MKKTLIRTVALLLVACLIADPAYRQAGPVTAAALSWSAASPRQSVSSPASSVFREQALATSLVAATRSIRKHPILFFIGLYRKSGLAGVLTGNVDYPGHTRGWILGWTVHYIPGLISTAVLFVTGHSASAQFLGVWNVAGLTVVLVLW